MSRKTTSIKNEFLDQKVQKKEFILDDNTLMTSIFDYEIDIKNRILALERFYELKGVQETSELIQRLCTMFQFSGLKAIKEYMLEICEKANIHILLKIIIADFFCSFFEDDELGYTLLSKFIKIMPDDIPEVLKLDKMFVLSKCHKYKEICLECIKEFFNTSNQTSQYKYKIIKNLSNILDEKVKSFYVDELSKLYFSNSKNDLRCRLLSAQYLLAFSNLDNEEKEQLLDELNYIGNNEDIEYNTRADAIDMLLKYATDEKLQNAKKLILKLGKEKGKRQLTTFDNKQNVHDVDESARVIIDFINTIEISKSITFENTCDEIKEYIENLLKNNKGENIIEKMERVDVAFNRIYLDNALYGEHILLNNVLIKLWHYIKSHENKEELQKRLFEELLDMADTCSSGYANRLANTLSGITEHSIKMTWGAQIKNNIAGRLNAKIREIDDEKFQTLILTEMTEENAEDRSHFLEFFRKHILSIRDELYDEFKEFVDDQAFDFHFRIAISYYETGIEDNELFSRKKVLNKNE